MVIGIREVWNVGGRDQSGERVYLFNEATESLNVKDSIWDWFLRNERILTGGDGGVGIFQKKGRTQPELPMQKGRR